MPGRFQSPGRCEIGVEAVLAWRGLGRDFDSDTDTDTDTDTDE